MVYLTITRLVNADIHGIYTYTDSPIDTQRDVQQRMSDALADAQLEYIHLTYYLTSIYDNSIYEAFSKIIQKLIRELPTLENLLNVLCSVRMAIA